MGQDWLRRKEAIAQFEGASHEAAPDVDPPSPRQIENILGSGLPAVRYSSGRREYEAASVAEVAKVLALSGGNERPLYATRDGPWVRLWLLYRIYREGTAVVMVNTAYMERVTGLPRKTLQRILDRGEIPSSEIGYTQFSPLKAVESWVKERGAAATGASGPRELPGPPHFAEPITSGIIKVTRYCQ